MKYSWKWKKKKRTSSSLKNKSKCIEWTNKRKYSNYVLLTKELAHSLVHQSKQFKKEQFSDYWYMTTKHMQVLDKRMVTLPWHYFGEEYKV